MPWDPVRAITGYEVPLTWPFPAPPVDPILRATGTRLAGQRLPF